MVKFYISIKSFEKSSITQSFNNIVKITSDLKTAIVHLPNKQKKLTVIRSPHIDKKSREQFTLKHYKSNVLIDVDDCTKQLYLLYLLKNFESKGVEVQISLKYTTFYTTI